MSKKRASAESRNDEQTNETPFQREDNPNHAKLNSLSDTTLQDLPIELLECILVRAVAMEVKGLMLAKTAWKEEADLVISRLSTVCSQWCSILSTNFFRNELHRFLYGTALQETIRLEILHESSIQAAIRAISTMKDEIFMLYRQDDEDYVMNVYNRNNMVEVIKDIIPLPGTYTVCMVACNVSNCVYVVLRHKIGLRLSVLRILKHVDHQLSMSPWIKNHRLPMSTISVSANGSLVILSLQPGRDPNIVSIYNTNGSLQHEIMLPPDIDAFIYENVIQKSDGNLVLAYVNERNHKVKLLEIDTGGSVVRKYQSSFSEECYVNFADIHGRIMITKPSEGIELLDSELNLLDIYSLKQDKGKNLFLDDLHYDSERNAIVRIHYDRNTKASVLTIFRFTEE